MEPAWIRAAAKVLTSGATRHRVFTLKSLREIYHRERLGPGTPGSLTEARFVEGLLSHGVVKKTSIKPERRATRNRPQSYSPFIRYLLPSASPAEVAISLRSSSYLSHLSAAQVHGILTSIGSDTVYANREQSEKPDREIALTQDGIDLAFKNRPRLSNYVYKFDNTRIVLLGGKNTHNYEVHEYKTNSGVYL